MTLRRSLAWVVVASLLPVLLLSAVLIGALDRKQRRETRDHVLRTVRALSEAVDAVTTGAATAAVLIRPVSVAEIERTAREGLLMPPKSTFFAPKLRTGFVVRVAAFRQVGCMDEGYFLYFEEVDLCARMWVTGWQVLAVPSVELVHEHQRHSAAGIWSKSGKTHLRSMARFFAKFGVPWLARPSRGGLARSYARWRAGPSKPALGQQPGN